MDKYFWLKIGLNCVELFAFVTGLLSWKKVKHSYWKWFVVYLGFILMLELTAKYIGYGLKNVKLNGEIYYFFGLPVQFFFIYWVFYKWFENRSEKIWPIIGCCVYILAWFADFLFLRGIRLWFSSFSYSMGNIILLVLIILFFLKFINSSEILNYKFSMMFWVCLGLILFYLGTFPFYALRNTLYLNYKKIFYPYWDISYVLNYLMYIFFALSFIWGKPK